MSAALDPFVDDLESVSAQARPILAAIEQLCRQFSISADSGVSTGTTSDGDQSVASTAIQAAHTTAPAAAAVAAPAPETAPETAPAPLSCSPGSQPAAPLFHTPFQTSASSSNSIFFASSAPPFPPPFASTSPSTSAAEHPPPPPPLPPTKFLPRPTPRPSRTYSRRQGSPSASDFGWGSAAHHPSSHHGPGPGWGPKLMLTRATGSFSGKGRRVSSLAIGSFTASSTPRSSICSRRNPGAPQPFLMNLPKDDEVPPSMMAIEEGAVMLSPGDDPEALSEEEEAWDAVARTLRPVADILRQPRLRFPIGSSQMPEHVLSLIRMSTVPRSSKYLAPLQDAQTQLLRVLGNLCVDCDLNRDRLLDLEAVSAIVAVVDGFLNDPVPDMPMLVPFDAATLYLLRAAAGAIENLELEHSPTQAYLTSNPMALRTLFRLGSSPRIYTPLTWTSGGYGFLRAESLRSDEGKELCRTGATIASRSWKVLQDVLASPNDAEVEGELSPGVTSLGARYSGSSRDSTTALSPGAVQPATNALSLDPQHHQRRSSQHRPRTRSRLGRARGGGVEACSAPSHAKALVIDTATNATSVVLRAFLDPRGKANKADQATWTTADRRLFAEADERILSAAAELIESSSLDSSGWRRAAVAPDSWADAVRYPTGLRNRTPMALYAAFITHATAPLAWRISRSDSHSRPSPRKSPLLLRQSAATDLLNQHHHPPSDVSMGELDVADGSWDEDEGFEQCRSALVRSLLAIVNEERAIDMLFHPSGTGAPYDGIGSSSWLADTLLQWLANTNETRPELISIALLALGSLVRTESLCIELVHKYSLGQRILPIFDATYARNLVQQSAALMGLMRNLALPNANKGLLGSLGWVDKAAAVLRSSRAQSGSTDTVSSNDLVFRTVLLLKNLAQGAAGNSVRVAAGPARDALASVATVTPHTPTSLEAGRVLGVVVQTLFLIPLPDAAALESAPHSPTNTETVHLARTMLAARDAVASPLVASALASMVRASSRYPVLVNEGLTGLGFISSGVAGAACVASALVGGTPARTPSWDKASIARTSPMSVDTGASLSPTNSSPTPADGSPEEAPAAAEPLASLRETPEPMPDADLSPRTQPHVRPPKQRKETMHADPLSMVVSVLARRDARMPPHYASNACALVIKLFAHASNRAPAPCPTFVADVHAIALRVTPALRTLASQSPTEALAVAQRALEFAQVVLAFPPGTSTARMSCCTDVRSHVSDPEPNRAMHLTYAPANEADTATT